MAVTAELGKLSLDAPETAANGSQSVQKAKSKDRVVAEMFDGKEEDVVAGGAGLNFEALVPFKGGLLVNQQYAVTPKQLNKIIFEQGSALQEEIRAIKGATQRVEFPWFPSPEEGVWAERTVTYMTATTKVLKSARALESQKYIAAGDGLYVVVISTAVPDLPMGQKFTTEVKFAIFAVASGSAPASGEKPQPITALQVSYQTAFSKSTMMKSVIKKGTEESLSETYDEFQKLLAKYATLVGDPPRLSDSGKRKK
ncbi:hypothetical protein KFL_000140590 [Klebsormidium nitens]|uniref:VASt domain-containing protein n=1 Tax=Klebsormidium nitens TaxID=105231 RepID=A0A1Y1HRS7_KLENI|nr:hypothetical protein KFL_000140590 [Klebsormidium nitens]|eukprot:GAQ78538.1 hypothetical protein KFL_000140590 [Klebsormidium nitens]